MSRQVEADLRQLQAVYALYTAHTEAVAAWSRQLWADADVGAIMVAAEEASQRLEQAKVMWPPPSAAADDALCIRVLQMAAQPMGLNLPLSL